MGSFPLPDIALLLAAAQGISIAIYIFVRHGRGPANRLFGFLLAAYSMEEAEQTIGSRTFSTCVEGCWGWCFSCLRSTFTTHWCLFIPRVAGVLSMRST